MRTFSGLDELELAVGTHLGYSDWHTISQEQVDLFAKVSGDHQWIHTDIEKAAHGPYGGTIAHGYLVLSLVPMLTRQIYQVDDLRMGVNYGSNKVRFPAPAPVGSRIRAGAELLEFQRVDMGARTIIRVTLERERGAKPCCVAEIISLMVDRRDRNG